MACFPRLFEMDLPESQGPHPMALGHALWPDFMLTL